MALRKPQAHNPKIIYNTNASSMNPSPTPQMNESPPEISLFQRLLAAEIQRMKDTHVVDPPEEAAPFSLNEYKQNVVAPMPSITQEQLARYKASTHEYFEGEIRKGARGGLARSLHAAGAKVLPVLMPGEHGFPSFSADHLAAFGNLTTYILNRNNLTMRPDRLAYMNAVLPPEIIGLAVPLPENLEDPTQVSMFFQAFDRSADKLLEITKGPFA